VQATIARNSGDSTVLPVASVCIRNTDDNDDHFFAYSDGGDDGDDEFLLFGCEHVVHANVKYAFSVFFVRSFVRIQRHGVVHKIAKLSVSLVCMSAACLKHCVFYRWSECALLLLYAVTAHASPRQ
jgi:hypothetical protein